MNPQYRPANVRKSPLKKALLAATSVVAMSLAAITFTATTATAAAVAPPLGTAEEFAVLAYSGITNTNTTTITAGDIGTTTSTITGVGPGADEIVPSPTVRSVPDSELARGSANAAYNNMAGQDATTLGGVELGGRTLFGDTYDTGGVLGLTGTLTLDGQGRNDSVWIFQSTSALTTAANSSVVLTNGAQACNVFWQIPSAATIGTGTAFVGTIITNSEAITVGQGATIDGRLISLNAAVTLNNNTIFNSGCAQQPPDTTTTAPTTTTPDTTTTTPDTGTTTTTDATTTTTDATTTTTSDETTTTEGTTTTTTEDVPPAGTTTTTLPTANTATTLPTLPTMTLPVIPGLPSLPNVPGLPNVPKQPNVPQQPQVPNMPATTQPAPESGQYTTPEAPSQGNQVPNVPRGSIDTGDGSSANGLAASWFYRFTCAAASSVQVS